MTVGTIIDLVILLLLLQAIFVGYHKGLLIMLAQLVALVIAYVGARCAVELLPKASDALQGIAIEGITYVAAFFVIELLLFQLIKMLHIVDHVPVVGFLNKLGGAIVGFCWIMLVLFVVSHLFYTFVPQAMIDAWGVSKHALKGTIFAYSFIP